MQRFMVHLRNRAFSSKDAALLLDTAQKTVPDTVTVRDARVSKKYLEFDVSIDDSEKIQNILKKMETISPVAEYEQVVERHMEKGEAIRKAISYFNDEKYWNAHEVLELVWKSSTGQEKDLLNGIILIAAAFVHDEKDEPDVALSILKRAMAKLRGSSGTYFGIDIDRAKELANENIRSGRTSRFTI